ncbi:MAG: hypothetical protein NW207_05285 [Cytophagales bacterium]|nr:hypothetical protein [Cytophagales bacterium]
MKNIAENKLFISIDALMSVSNYEHDTDEGLFDEESDWEYLTDEFINNDIFPSHKLNYRHLFNPLYLL